MNNFNNFANPNISLLERFKNFYKTNGVIGKLIIINAAVFLVVNVLVVLLRLFYIELPFSPLAVSSDLESLIYRPWGVFTYMFMHDGFMHLLINMLWLYWFGRMFVQMISKELFLYVYLIGGLFGAAAFVASYNFFPLFENKIGTPCVGASAAVMSIVFSVALFSPNQIIKLMFIGKVKLLYIAIGYLFIDLLQMTSDNAGGHISHLGGALFGMVFITLYKNGRNPLKVLMFYIDKLSNLLKRRPKMKVEYTKSKKEWNYNADKKAKSKNIDKILDKIKAKGYDSLTKEEKEQIFKS